MTETTFKLHPCSGEDARVGHCPKCHHAVFENDGPVWTCPTNLNPENPHYVEGNSDITEAVQEKAGVYSNCGEDFGLYCPTPDMPLHSKCYDSDDGYTY